MQKTTTGTGRATRRPNNMNTSYTYDNLSRLLSVLHQTGATTIDGATCTLDNAGNRTSKLNQLNGVTENYTYDPIYQLTQVQQVVNGNSSTSESYTYDAVGNRLSSMNVASYSVNSSNEVTTSSDGTTYTYDANGNTLTKSNTSGTTQYGWNLENRLSSVTLPNGGGTVAYRYDPFGRRIQKTGPLGTTNYLYDGSNAIEELDVSGVLAARYTQDTDIDRPLAMLRSGITSFYDADGIGSITSVSNAAGALAQTYTFNAFGKLIASSGSITNPFQFTGREFDNETNLQFSRARYYDSVTGRFLSEDPIRSGTNFYAYVHNGPTNFIDPFGLQDNASPWQVGWEWLTGMGPRTHHFTDGDPFTELLRHHEHIQELINDVCKGNLPPNNRFDYQLGGFGGVPKYIRDYSTLFTGGMTGNLAVTYLGSYGRTSP